jgi:hypothetical protein
VSASAGAAPGRRRAGAVAVGAFVKRVITLTPAPSHPLAECSPRALFVLCGLALSPRDLARILDAHDADVDPRAVCGEAMRLVVERIRTDAGAAARLDRALELRLWGAATRYVGWTIAELAEFWSRERASLDSSHAAAILWALGREAGPLRRTLETRIAEDIETFALDALARRRHFAKPFGFCCCHRQLSRHMVSRSRSARQPRSSAARAGSAYTVATSPGRRGTTS